MALEPAITTYGEKNPQAPAQLSLFSFLVGKWKGTGKTRLEDGSHAQFELTWIGRYILNGMAVADEIHSLDPDGKPYLGISIRHFDAKEEWIIEYLNISNSFLRRQVKSTVGNGERGCRSGRRHFREWTDEDSGTLARGGSGSLHVQHGYVTRWRPKLGRGVG